MDNNSQSNEPIIPKDDYLPDAKSIDGFIPSKADMEFCPLCDERFTLYEEPTKLGKVMFVCLGKNCMIRIWVRDPMLGRWRRVESESCPICSEKNMRIFFRSDGYIKLLCRKCGYACETVDEEIHDAILRHEVEQGKRIMFRKPKEPTDGFLPGTGL